MAIKKVRVGNSEFGGDKPVLIAGPCSVENEEMIREVAFSIKASGAGVLRGGTWKPRTSPYSFQGLGAEGMMMLSGAGRDAGLPVVSEILAESQLEAAMDHLDMIQVGARNMHNFPLLTQIGRCGKPVLLKRGFMATVEEWLLAAEYILKEGNESVVLCERGIRTFEPWTRATLDISAVPLARQASSLPVIVDPCHAAGRRDIIMSLAMASLGAGADGLMIEVHPDPDKALSDGGQSLNLNEFNVLAGAVRDYGWPPERYH